SPARQKPASGASKRPGRLGSPSTRKQIAEIAKREIDEGRELGREITGGGGQKKEEYTPGPGGKRLGSTAADITLRDAMGTYRINTVDTRGKRSFIPDKREMRNLGKQLKAHRGEGIFAIPKRR